MASDLQSPLQSIFGPVLRSGSLVNDAVQIKLGGKVYDGWKSVSIRRSMDSIAATFSIETADKWRQSKEAFPIMPGKDVKISIGIKPVLTGYIEQMNASVSNDDRSISIAGRDRTADVIDSAAIFTSSTFTNKTLAQLAQIYVDNFDISVVDKTPLPALPIKKIVVEQGEAIAELLLRYARPHGVLLSSDNDGNLVLTTNGAGTTAANALTAPMGQDIRKAIGKPVGLFQGQNVLSASSTYDDTVRFQAYLVKSQIQGNDFVNAKDASTINGVAFDSDVLRPRFKYIIADKSMTNSEAKSRAIWESSISAQKAARASVTVQGWYDQNGELWDINRLVDTDLRFIGFGKQKYLITAIDFTQTKDGGTLTTLELSRTDAFLLKEPDKKKDPKKDAGWDTKVFGENLQDVVKTLGYK